MPSVVRRQSPPRLQLGESQQSPISKKPSFGLTFSRGWLVKLAEETLRIADVGYYHTRDGKQVDIQEELRNSMENSIHYHSSHTFDLEQTLPLEIPFQETEFHVCYGSSLQVARRLREQLELCDQSPSSQAFHIGVLNSASGRRPDKFLRGTVSQEESICRATLLYPCLIQYHNRPHHFYFVNHKKKYQDSPSACAIFSPQVPMIREDSMEGHLLEEHETCSFVSIPAPNAFALGAEEQEAVVPKAQKPGSCQRNEPYETMTIEAAMHDRIFRALSIFAQNGCTDLVLCAFGCGVHGNDPYQIATIFRDILDKELKGRFRTVAFSIHPSRHHNYEEFVKVFGDNCNCAPEGISE